MSEDVVHPASPISSPKVVFGRRRNSTSHAADELGMSDDSFSARLHKLKRSAGLRGNDDVTIYNDGDAYNANGECIGNVCDENG